MKNNTDLMMMELAISQVVAEMDAKERQIYGDAKAEFEAAAKMILDKTRLPDGRDHPCALLGVSAVYCALCAK